MSSDRKQYRVSQRRRLFTLTIQAPGSELVEGVVVDLSSRGAAGLFDAGRVSGIAPGTHVALELQALLLTRPIRAQGIVRHVGDEDGAARLGLEFVEPRKVMRQVPYVMLREFNRRRAPRAEVGEVVEVEAVLRGGRGALRGHLVDVSTGGLCMKLAEEPRGGVPAEGLWELRFELPGIPRPLTWVGSLCALRSDSTTLVTSVEFDPEATPEYEAQRAAVEAFVSSRLADEHARRNGGPDPR